MYDTLTIYGGGNTRAMNEIIRKRKSIRNYELTSLDAGTLEEVQKQIDKAKPLYGEIQCSVEIVSKTKGLFNTKAPHYLIFRSEEKDGAYENIGFIGQQLNLYFAESELGACWLGASKPIDKEKSALPHVISMAFGKPMEPLYRTLSEFKRKALNEISEGMDERLDAAQLAPSGMNAQNWYFIADEGNIHCYRKDSGPLLGFIYNKLSCIDIGIALCHIAEESSDFRFLKEQGVPVRKGLIYIGTVSSRQL